MFLDSSWLILCLPNVYNTSREFMQKRIWHLVINKFSVDCFVSLVELEKKIQSPFFPRLKPFLLSITKYNNHRFNCELWYYFENIAFLILFIFMHFYTSQILQSHNYHVSFDDSFYFFVLVNFAFLLLDVCVATSFIHLMLENVIIVQYSIIKLYIKLLFIFFMLLHIYYNIIFRTMVSDYPVFYPF